jgi:D-3-phosphoglycerate dehydrogenase
VAKDLHSALRQADVLTLHCPLTAQTRGMIGAAELALLPPGALVINLARGGLVDEAALAVALRSGGLGGAARDVTCVEPLPPDDPLRRAPRLILTPHAAGLGQGAFRRMGMDAAQNSLDHAAGRPRPGCTVVAGV